MCVCMCVCVHTYACLYVRACVENNALPVHILTTKPQSSGSGRIFEMRSVLCRPGLLCSVTDNLLKGDIGSQGERHVQTKVMLHQPWSVLCGQNDQKQGRSEQQSLPCTPRRSQGPRHFGFGILDSELWDNRSMSFTPPNL